MNMLAYDSLLSRPRVLYNMGVIMHKKRLQLITLECGKKNATGKELNTKERKHDGGTKIDNMATVDKNNKFKDLDKKKNSQLRRHK